ncbi:hypothetical protein WJU23_11985 [Prosthecobacter sp. SYSU 5D2]|uniref:hypothetical protein n=1 Tax=Prosthecobacter sp. SYSU 5D2 TaxID=3134134 RepID=UPI0031FEF8B0
MSSLSFGLLALTVGMVLAGTSCSQVEPAGSLGYMMRGDTNLRPTPTNFRHVPPRDQDRTPTPMQWGLDF